MRWSGIREEDGGKEAGRREQQFSYHLTNTKHLLNVSTVLCGYWRVKGELDSRAHLQGVYNLEWAEAGTKVLGEGRKRASNPGLEH